jgi:hypothetical protein
MTPFAKKPPKFDGKVFLGMPMHRTLEPETHFSIVKTIYALADQGIPSMHANIKGSSIIEVARSRVCEEFLKTDATHLFMLDSDQVWEARDFLRILSLGMVLPVVGGIYPIKRDPPKFYVSYDPRRLEWNGWGCLAIKGMGLGFTCVQRKVIEQLAQKAPKILMPERAEPLAHIFRCDVVDGTFRGEDVAFFADCRNLGYPCWLEPKVCIGHVGHKVYEANFLDGLQCESAETTPAIAVAG